MLQISVLHCIYTFATILEKGYPLCQEMPGIVDCASNMFLINVAVITKHLCNANAVTVCATKIMLLAMLMFFPQVLYLE